MKIREILLEYNKDYLKSNFEKKYEQKRNNDHSLPRNTSFDDFLERIEIPLKQQNKFQIIDPYMKWIAEKYVNDGIRYFEDVYSKTIPALLTYDALKRKNKLKPEHKDIGKIKSLDDLLDILDGYKEEDTKSGKEQEKETEQNFYKLGEAELLYNDSNIKVVVPKSERASCFFGRNTRWCTAATQSSNLFWKYAKQGEFYIVLIKKNNERYQFHFETEQFMDEKDKPISPLELAEKYPKLYDIFEPIAKRKKLIFFQRNLSEEDQLEAVNKRPYNIKHIRNPTERVQLIVVNRNPDMIEYIRNPTERVQLIAVKQNGKLIEYIENPSEAVQLAAVKQNGYAIQHIENPSEKVQLAAVNQKGDSIYYIKNPSEEVQLAAVNQNGHAIQDIENPSEEVQLAAVKQNGRAIQYIKNPSEDVQLAAVKQTGYAIELIENPSEAVQLAAVKNTPEAIKYIKNPSARVLDFIKNR